MVQDIRDEERCVVGPWRERLDIDLSPLAKLFKGGFCRQDLRSHRSIQVAGAVGLCDNHVGFGERSGLDNFNGAERAGQADGEDVRVDEEDLEGRDSRKVVCQEAGAHIVRIIQNQALCRLIVLDIA